MTPRIMPILPGARLGPYEVVALLGAGGMGQVYKARDTRLGRSVALKMLHANIAQEPGLRERFEREARAVSALSHPHICALYDVGEHDGSEFLVMELVEGETLADRLRRGRLALDLAIRYAIEIAEGLEHAHRHGITHRDLKPANVILARSGAKLLDFGLAKLHDPATETSTASSGAADPESGQDLATLTPSNSPTVNIPLTQTGAVLGTFEYMAPEQFQGREADTRTDIFAFGALLYEAVTGRRAFDASDRASLIAAVLMTEPPPMRQLDPRVPLMLDHIVQRCLAKDPEDRWQSVRDLLIALQWVAEGVSTPVMSKRNAALNGLTIALMLVALVIGFAGWNATRPARVIAPVPTKLDLAIPAGEALATEFFPSLAVSPDGMYIVSRMESDSVFRLHIRRLDQFESRPIDGAEGAHSPFFSPDSRWVGFLSNSRIYRVAVAGGAALPIADAQSLSPGSPGVTWGTDGTIVFAAGGSGLMRVSEAGGEPAPLTAPDTTRGEVSHVEPQFLPGGKELLFSIRTENGGWRVAVLSLTTQQWQWLPPLGDDVAGARYVRTGHLVYVQAGHLSRIPFDLARRTFTGPAEPLAEPVYTRTVADAIVAQFAISEAGLLAYVSGRPPDWTLVSVGADGSETPIGTTPHLWRYPRVSPDGRSIAVSIEEKRTDIYLVDAGSGRLRQLTATGSNTQPSWTPDSQRVTFASRRSGSNGWDTFWMPADGSADAEPLIARPGGQFPTSWSKGDGRLAFYELGNKSARDIWMWFTRERKAESVIVSPANERGATFSPDGRFLAYVSNANERDEVYVQQYPGPSRREVVSSGGGTEPVWSPIRRELFYRNNNRLYAVTIRTEPRITADPPREVLRGSYVASPMTGLPNYDVFPDGRTFVMVRSARSEMHLHLIPNWFEQIGAASSR